MKINRSDNDHDIEKVSREELISIVQMICDSVGTEEEIDKMIQILSDNVPHPRVSDLIFWPEKEFSSANEIVDEALAYKPIQL